MTSTVQLSFLPEVDHVHQQFVTGAAHETRRVPQFVVAGPLGVDGRRAQTHGALAVVARLEKKEGEIASSGMDINCMCEINMSSPSVRHRDAIKKIYVNSTDADLESGLFQQCYSGSIIAAFTESVKSERHLHTAGNNSLYAVMIKKSSGVTHNPLQIQPEQGGLSQS